MKKRTLGRAIRYRVRGPLVVLFLKLFARLPLPLNHAIGAGIGRLLYMFSGEMRYTTTRNLEVCMPELSPSERTALARKCIVETGKAMTEMAAFWCWPAQKVAEKIRAIHGEEHLARAIDAGKGVLMVTPHIGSWEVIPNYVASRYPMTIMYRPSRIQALDNIMLQGRKQTGAKVVPADASGIRNILQALKRGEVSGILPDQEPVWGGGIFVPFFGIQAYTITLFARLACKVQPALIACYAKRLPRGRGYEIVLEPMAEAAKSCDEVTSLTELNQTVEKMIRSCPEQFQWSYRRFRKRPQGEPKIYERLMKK